MLQPFQTESGPLEDVNKTNGALVGHWGSNRPAGAGAPWAVLGQQDRASAGAAASSSSPVLAAPPARSRVLGSARHCSPTQEGHPNACTLQVGTDVCLNTGGGFRRRLPVSRCPPGFS